MLNPVKTVLFSGVVLFSLLLIPSCANLTQDEIEERVGIVEIEIIFDADANLNLFKTSPSSTTLCIYQLASRQAYDTLFDSESGLDTLMEFTVFDASVIGKRRVFINPGEKTTIRLERRHGAHYLLIAAGFHGSDMAGATKLLDLPSVTLASAKRQKMSIKCRLDPHAIGATAPVK